MSQTTKTARNLRKHMTDSERKLWGALRNRQLLGKKFRRQAPIGQYFADFVCFEKRFVIEVDGSQHKDRIKYDEKRTAWLRSQGFEVLRFWNNDVLQNIEGVVERIMQALEGLADHPHPGPPPSRGRERRPKRFDKAKAE